MNDVETMLRNYSRAQRVQSWADLFGFKVEMGRDPEPFIDLSGDKISDPDPFVVLVIAAQKLGMDYKDFKGAK